LSRAWSVKADARMFETISLNWGIIYVSLKIYTNFFENYSVECYSKIIRNILAGYLQTLAKKKGGENNVWHRKRRMPVSGKAERKTGRL
jgi:hypothetical protein